MATRPTKAKVVHSPPARRWDHSEFAERLEAVVDLGKFGEPYELKRYDTHRGSVQSASRLRHRADKLPSGVRWEWTTGEDPRTGEGVLYVTMHNR